MGIKDLLRFMKPYIEPIHISKYASQRVGVDAYSWLHKGAYSCSMEICLDTNGTKKLRYLDFFMHRVNLLRHYKVTPVVVFDGGNIPCKSATEDQRHRKREANRELAMEKLKGGNVDAAAELFQKAVSITPLMAHQLIQTLRSENIEFVVAPYEADAQLAYLSSLGAEEGGITAVITEDSDLLAYGCQATIFKMDRYGNGEEVVLDKIFYAESCKPSFQCFDRELFTGMCVLSGCDFLPSIPGIGIVKAHSFVSKYRNLDRVLSVLKLEKGNLMPEDYSKSFRQAVAVFRHAQIYDAKSKMLKHMKTLSQNFLESMNGELDFLGPDIPSSVASAIAEGNINPKTMEAFDYFPSSQWEPRHVTQICSRLHKANAIVASRKRSHFVAFSSGEPTKNGATGMMTKQDAILTERKYINEALRLRKLVSPPEVPIGTEKAFVHNNTPLKGQNNPFMIRELEESRWDTMEAGTEEVLALKEDEKENVSRVTPNVVRSKVYKDNISKKRKHIEVYLDHKEMKSEQSSELTEAENISITNDSQDSVNSKPRKTSVQRRRCGNMTSNRNINRNLGNKKSTILDFFSQT